MSLPTNRARDLRPLLLSAASAVTGVVPGLAGARALPLGAAFAAGLVAAGLAFARALPPAAAFAACLAAAGLAGAQALPPAVALEWNDPELEAARRLVTSLEEEVARSGRVSLDASIDPGVRFRDYPGDSAAGEWSGRLGIGASLDLGEPADTRARTRQRLARARRDLALLELDSIGDALLAHANLLVAQGRERDARLDLEEARAAAGATSFEVRQADLEHREALFELEEARARARSFGIEGSAVYEPLRFELPGRPFDPYGSHEYRLLQLELLEAEAELAEAERSRLDDLRLRGGYRLRGVGIELEGGLLNGEPGATLAVDLPGGVERWEVEVRAQLLLSDDGHELRRLEEAVADARAELAAYPRRFEVDLERALALALLAEEGLDLAEEELEAEGESARPGLYRAWISYLRSVAELLELTGGQWRVRPPR